MNVFLSYKWESPEHNDWVERFASDLKMYGLTVQLDRWDVRFGDSFTDYMTGGVRAADVVLFVMTDASVNAVEGAKGKGGGVKFEMQMATARRTAGEPLRLIGIYRSGKRPPIHLKDHRYADFSADTTYHEALRQLVADLLGSVPVPAVLSRLIRMLDDALNLGDTHVAAVAAAEIADLRHPGAVRPLLRLAAYEGESDHEYTDIDGTRYPREYGAGPLRDMGSVAIPELVSVLLNPKEDVPIRAQAAELLGQMNAQPAVAALIRSVADSEEAVATSACYALAEIRSPDAVPALVDALRTPDRSGPAGFALSCIGAPAVHPLINCLSSTNLSVRKEAADALFEMGETALSELEAAVDQGDSRRRRAVRKILERIAIGAKAARQWDPRNAQKEPGKADGSAGPEPSTV